MITISVGNAKGGVAKTTTAQALAIYLSSNNKKTLVMDLDPQANITKSLLALEIGDFPGKPTMYEVFYSYIMERKKNIIAETARPVTGNENLFLLPATLKMEQFKDIIKGHAREPIKVLKELIKPIEKDYDYLIIDCPADLSIYVEGAIKASDYILCPSIYDYFGLDGLSLIIPTITEIKSDDFQNYKVLYTIFEAQSTKIQEKLKQFADELESTGNVLPFKIPKDQGVKNSQADCIDFMNDKTYSKSKAKLAYEKLGNFVLENWK
jgi:chromosome partitioning protein